MPLVTGVPGSPSRPQSALSRPHSAGTFSHQASSRPGSAFSRGSPNRVSNAASKFTKHPDWAKLDHFGGEMLDI